LDFISNVRKVKSKITKNIYIIIEKQNKMIKKQFKEITLSCLGMGNMRLPVKDDGTINDELAKPIIDKAMASGINYYDTAYVYNKGESEKFLGRALVDQYPRDTFYLADKFNINANPNYKEVFEEQCERLHTSYIDFYLIHCLTDDIYDKLVSSGAIDYFNELKRIGRIHYFGFSSHASVGILNKFVEQNQWDFVQIQLNYYDYLFGSAKEEYTLLENKQIPVMVMESVRGGKLSSLSKDAEALLLDKHPDWSISSWAFRFLQTLPMVQVCLSGMSNANQVQDNVKTFQDLSPLNDEDKSLLFEAASLFRKNLMVPCTACGYCLDSCPSEINIPAFLNVYNEIKTEGPWMIEKVKSISTKGSFEDCISCQECLHHCPQKIDSSIIMMELKKMKQK
jgi:predicted aldo/keto reductase-like oxidoreductase